MLIDEMKKQEEIAEKEGLPLPEVHLLFKKPGQHLDPSRYNVPHTNEIAVVFIPGADNEPPETNIVVKKDGELKMLDSFDPMIDRMVI